MASGDLIDAQFDRAVEIVQGLPKTGPIQTDYEEKLTMYSLYKQATVGNVKGPRPGIWDMLGRAKWDAWAKHKDLNSYEAKWLYVEALLKVLRKYSDKTMARDLVDELESLGGDPSNIVMSGTLPRSTDSESSGSISEEEAQRPSQYRSALGLNTEGEQDEDADTGTEEDGEEGQDDAPAPLEPGLSRISQLNRPQSSMSSHRYRTPIAASLATSPPPPVPAHQALIHQFQESQPMPGFETPSAFAEPSVSTHSSVYPIGSSFVGQFTDLSRDTSSPNAYPMYRASPQLQRQYGPIRPASRPTLERAVEHIQSQVAALHERLDSLESLPNPSHSRLSVSPGVHTPLWGRNTPTTNRHEWDLDDLGMWSHLLQPLSRLVDHGRRFSRFLAKDETRSPTAIVVRRLCLDISFLLFILGLFRFIWKKSGVRRREVKGALIILWRAVLGTSPPRHMVDRAVGA